MHPIIHHPSLKEICYIPIGIQNPPVLPGKEVFGTPKSILRKFGGSNTYSPCVWMSRVCLKRHFGGPGGAISDAMTIGLSVQKFHVDGMHIHKPKWCGSHLKIKASNIASGEKVFA